MDTLCENVSNRWKHLTDCTRNVPHGSSTLDNISQHLENFVTKNPNFVYIFQLQNVNTKLGFLVDFCEAV